MTHKGKTIDFVNGYEVIACEECGFFHILPIPSQKELNEMYGKEYYSSEKPVYFKEAEEDLEWWTEVYKRYYNLIGKYISQKNILDIGSGPGYFLKIGQGLGWETLGFEPSIQAFEYSKKLGLNIINDFFSSEKAEIYGKFNVVSAIDVMEHLPDPFFFLNEVKKVLSENGLLFLILPNDYEPSQNLLRNKMGFKPWWVAPPHHINYLNFKSIQDLLNKNGFKILEVTTNFPMDFFLFAGKNYVSDPSVGKECHKMRKLFETNFLKNDPDLLKSFYKFLSEAGLGRDLIIIARYLQKEI